MDYRLKLLNYLNLHPFVLAPMAAITDSPYRQLLKRWGAGILVTELVSATGYFYGSEKTKEMFQFHPCEKPVGLQLFGETSDHIVAAAKYAQELGYDFIDINCGCPVPKVVKKGAGSALLREPKNLQVILRSLVSQIKIPVTIKIRTGWDEKNKNALEIAQMASDEGVLWVAIHGRTRAQGYEGRADWELIGEVAQKTKIPIIGNGDVVSAIQAVEYKEKYGCAGVMIGRGALKDPFIFGKALKLYRQRHSLSGEGADTFRDRAPMIEQGRLVSLLAFCQDMMELFESQYPRRIADIQIKKILTWMATGFPDAAKFRRDVYACVDRSALKILALEYFKGLSEDSRWNQDNEGFLMGGHG